MNWASVKLKFQQLFIQMIERQTVKFNYRKVFVPYGNTLRLCMVIINICYTLRLLGHMYAAEALVLMDQTSEALQHLSPDLISNNEEQFSKTGHCCCYCYLLLLLLCLLLSIATIYNIFSLKSVIISDIPYSRYY